MCMRKVSFTLDESVKQERTLTLSFTEKVFALNLSGSWKLKKIILSIPFLKIILKYSLTEDM